MGPVLGPSAKLKRFGRLKMVIRVSKDEPT